MRQGLPHTGARPGRPRRNDKIKSSASAFRSHRCLTSRPDPQLKPLPRLLFISRWLQLPLYLGLIVAQAVYVWYFMVELLHLVEAAFGTKTALDTILRT